MSVNVVVTHRKELQVNKKQRSQLEALQRKWRWESPRAKADPVAFILDRAKKDYVKVMGAETGVNKWQAEALRVNDVTGFKTREEERERACEVLRDSFSGFPEDSIQRMLSEKVAREILGLTAKKELDNKVEVVTDPRDPAFIYPKPMFRYSASAVVAGVLVAGCAAPAAQSAWAYDAGWEQKVTDAQTVLVTSVSAPDATRGLGIYIPNMVFPAGRDAPITSGFGYRDAPCTTCSTNHEGLDFNPGYGSPVYSATDGVVTWVGWEGSLGYHVVVQDAGTWHLYYGHMIDGSAPAGLTIGSRVKMGQQIGLVGSTGQSTGAHLHFAIQDEGAFVDPYPLLMKYAN
jgi:murein DD-endopeptidase MepM/ murein hydrolase activator NlpD